jgi:hypothetical protein
MSKLRLLMPSFAPSALPIVVLTFFTVSIEAIKAALKNTVDAIWHE